MSRKKERNTSSLQPTLKKALEEYETNLMKDTEEGYRIKKAVQELEEPDRIILLLYCELSSYTELSRILGVSRSTLWWAIRRVKGILREKLSDLQR